MVWGMFYDYYTCRNVITWYSKSSPLQSWIFPVYMLKLYVGLRQLWIIADRNGIYYQLNFIYIEITLYFHWCILTSFVCVLNHETLIYFRNTSMRRIWVHNDIHITCTKIVEIFHNFIINRAVKSEKELYVQCKKKINTQYPHAVITCLLFYWPCVTMWGIFFGLKKPQASLNNA